MDGRPRAILRLSRERQFSSDVTHELRTPVSEIRALSEVGLRWPDEKDIRSYFNDIHESSQHLDRLIKNLLSNAISHSPPGSRIYIEAEMNAKQCAILFSNPMADPLSSVDLEMIFNRFWRKDRARETGRHAGIGLSLVRSYVDLMGLEVSASISDNRFRIRLTGLELSSASES
jgi:signal transduction histidine kinase